MNTKTHILIWVVVILAAAGLVWWFGLKQHNGAVPGGAPQQEVASSTPQQATPSADVVPVSIKNIAFSPAFLVIKKGAKVVWTNEDDVNHTVTGDAKASLIKSSPLPKGGEYSLVFATRGTFPYHCSIHPSMKGTIVVTE